jgi:hypothetical protein
MAMRRLIGLSLGLLLLASCDRSQGPAEAPTAAAAFRHSMTSDLSGYYRPAGEVRVGKWSLDHVFVGQDREFRGWEAGSRNGTFGPVMLQFEDVNSPMVQTATGEASSLSARVLPTAYSVSDTAISFEGRSPELGMVRFDGVLDPGALAMARRNLGDEGVVVTGRLTVGDAPVQSIRLRWWGGD